MNERDMVHVITKAKFLLGKRYRKVSLNLMSVTERENAIGSDELDSSFFLLCGHLALLVCNWPRWEYSHPEKLQIPPIKASPSSLQC